MADRLLSRSCCLSRHAGHPLRRCRKTTAAAAAQVLFWTSQLSRWPTWIQECLLFHLVTDSGTCCWGTRHFRMMTGSMKNTLYFCLTCERLPRDIVGRMCAEWTFLLCSSNKETAILHSWIMNLTLFITFLQEKNLSQANANRLASAISILSMLLLLKEENQIKQAWLLNSCDQI